MINDRCNVIIDKFNENMEALGLDEIFKDDFLEYVQAQTDKYLEYGSDLYEYDNYIKDKVIKYLSDLYDNQKTYFYPTIDDEINELLASMNDQERKIYILTNHVIPFNISYQYDKNLLIKDFNISEDNYDNVINNMIDKVTYYWDKHKMFGKINLSNLNTGAKK